MSKYDPAIGPDPAEWGSLEDDEKLEIVQQYHEQHDADLPDVALHSLIQTVVENQVALGAETPVADTLARLKKEGLDRHDAIHAVASVLVNYLYEMMGGSDASGHTEQYYEALTELTAESWGAQGGDAT